MCFVSSATSFGGPLRIKLRKDVVQASDEVHIVDHKPVAESNVQLPYLPMRNAKRASEEDKTMPPNSAPCKREGPCLRASAALDVCREPRA